MHVETIDLSHFTNGTQEQRQNFIDGLLYSFDKTGFVKLTNHGFSEDELRELFGWSKTFFDQPQEVKNEIFNDPGPKPMRGYMGTGLEHTGKLVANEKDRAKTDAKESFDLGPTEDSEFPNKWPQQPQMDGFKPFMEAFYKQCDEVCLTMIRALEVGFGVKEGAILERCVPSATDLRLTHYPPIPVKELKEGGKTRISQHSDFGVITLLFQDTVGPTGLEIEDRSKENAWDSVAPNQVTEMIVNVGDTLQRWTNDKIIGGLHRVTIPETVRDDDKAVLPARTSMAYLFKAQRHESVGPLPDFVSEEEPAKYPEMNALEYQQVRNNVLFT